MIAKVRIAPVERWCEPMQEEYRRRETPQLIGMEAAINTRSMRAGNLCINRCESREWLLEDSAAKRLRETIGIGPASEQRVWICEHMLEMD